MKALRHLDTSWPLGLARWALALSYLSAVADRLGMWGANGDGGVVWGDYAHFLMYVGALAPWAPDSLVAAIGFVVTALEVVLAALLLFGWRLRTVALASAVLLGLFGLSMALFTSLKSALDYSVFSAAAASLLLARSTSD